MAAKRSCHATSDAMALDHIRVTVVQCLNSHQDVVAFLRALPSLDGPLTALQQLLMSSSTAMKQWPVIVLDLVDPEYIDLAMAALPALPKIHISHCETLQRALAGCYDSLGAFAAAWPTKITHLDQCVYLEDVPDVASWIQYCTRLDFMCFHVNALATVLPYLPPSFRRVMFIDDDNNEDEDDSIVESNLAPSLRHWLGKGLPNKHINFNCKLAKDDAAVIADLLASDLSVATLEMTKSYELVQALIASTKSLSHVTSFGIRMVPIDVAKQLVVRLNLTHLMRLKVEAATKDLTWVLPLLPSMPHLQELSLGFGSLDEMPDTLGAAIPRLRKLALNHIKLSDATFHALLKWTSGTPQLQSAVFRGLSLNGQWFSLQLTTRHHWLVTAGVCALVIDGQTVVSPPSLQGLAIHLDTVEALVRALSCLVNTTVRLATYINADTYKEVTRRAWMDFHVAMLPREYNEYDLCSPYCRESKALKPR